MRKIILYAAASIDNYIARPNGDINWLHDPDFITPGQDYGYNDFYKSIDTTLMGSSTYQMIESFDVPFPYPDKDNYVFSRNKNNSDTKDVTFVSENIIEFIRNLKSKPGKNIWLVGGGEINSLLLAHGLIDTIILTIIPTLLGEGIPMFKNQKDEAKFILEKTEQYDDKISQLYFRLP